MFSKCGAGEDSWVSLDCKEIKPVNPKRNQSWIFIGRTYAEAEAEAPLLWPPDAKGWLIGKDWCWARLKEGEGDDRGWDGWMASLTQWTWVWTNSGRWWRTGKPFMLWSMGLQRVRHDLVTEQQRVPGDLTTSSCLGTKNMAFVLPSVEDRDPVVLLFCWFCLHPSAGTSMKVASFNPEDYIRIEHYCQFFPLNECFILIKHLFLTP